MAVTILDGIDGAATVMLTLPMQMNVDSTCSTNGNAASNCTGTNAE